MSILSLSGLAAPRADFFVATNGSDTNPGTVAKPFATLARARDAVRALGQPNRDVTVLIRGGSYRLAETVVFSRADGAAKGRTVTYAAYPGETPVFSSDQPVTGWQRLTDEPDYLPAAAHGKVWVADVSAILARKANRQDPPHGAGEPPEARDRNRFYSLYLGNQHLPRARGKGFSPTNHTAVRHRKDTTHLRFPRGALRNWPDLSEAELRIIPCSFWIQDMLPFQSVDEDARTAEMAQPGTYALGKNSMTDRDSCFAENTLAALDQPGEWVLHTSEKRLYYWPKADRPEAGVAAPILTEYIRIEGDIDYAGPKDTPTRGIVLKGLRFEHGDRMSWHGNTGWGLQHDWEMFDRPTAMVRLRGAEECAILDCEFTNSAHAGIRLDLYAQHNRIEGNHIHQVGGVGILLAGYGPGTKDVNRDNEIRNNYLHHTGWMHWAAPSLFVWQSGHNQIAHNHLHHTPYTAIVVSGRISWSTNGWGECSRTCRFDELEAVLGKGFKRPNWQGREPFLHARHNMVEYNDLHNVMQITGDGNTIYVSGCGTGNTIRRNWCHDNFGSYMNAVIRNDDDQHGSIFDGNIIARSAGHAEGFINKGANTIVNNIVADLRPTHRHRAYLVLVRYDQTGAVHKDNVYYATRPDVNAIGETKPGGRSKTGAMLKDVDSDDNIYFNTADPAWGQAVLDHFQPQGVEKDSRAVDPMFVNAAEDDYHFRPGSPALAMGIPQPMDVQECGLEKPYRRRWYGAQMRTRIEPLYGKLEEGTRITITASDPQATIRYTTDGTEPTEASPRYTGPFALTDNYVVRARAFAPGKVDLTGSCSRFIPPPQPIVQDFEQVEVGESTPGATTSEQAPFTARVTDEQAASGTHSLKFIDGEGQKYPFNPHVYYRMRFETGRMVGRFALRVGTESEFYYQWRMYEGGKFLRGPGVRINQGGKLVHEDRELMDIPVDAWARFEVTAPLGEANKGTFDLRVTLPDGTVKEFRGLPYEKGFTRLDWVGFVSVADHACVSYVDDIEVRPQE
jgi:hypothetical protein